MIVVNVQTEDLKDSKIMHLSLEPMLHGPSSIYDAIAAKKVLD